MANNAVLQEARQMQQLTESLGLPDGKNESFRCSHSLLKLILTETTALTAFQSKTFTFIPHFNLIPYEGFPFC